MKKTVSLFIALVMALSVMTFVPVTAGATEAGHTLSGHNVAIDVPYFSGTVNYHEITGNISKPLNEEDMGSINYADKQGDGVIDLDGVVTEAEWGLPIAEITREYAATFKGTEPSGENTYWWHAAEGANLFDSAFELSYKVWMAWDEDYLYIAAVVDDPDGPFGNQLGANIWNGDCLQFMIDPEGPNSISGGTEYDPGVNPFPWHSSAVQTEEGRTVGGKTANIGVAYTGPTTKAGRPGMFDMSARYEPTMITDDAGERRLTWSGYDIYSYDFEHESELAPNPLMGEKYAYAAIKPVLSRTPLNPNHYVTTYEVAIPWELCCGSEISFDKDTETVSYNIVEPGVKAGDEYGFSMVMLGGGRGGSDYNQWLTWGSGVCGAQTNGALEYPTAGGSNSLVLVSDELGSNTHRHSFAAPTCTQPYVCACGYKRGFAVGHDYASRVITALASDRAGQIRSVCSYCGGVVETTVENVGQRVDCELSEGARTGGIPSSSEWNTGDTQNEWSNVYRDESGSVIFNPDGTMKTTYVASGDQMIFDLTDGDAGTYFSTRNNRKSYSYKYDLRMTGADLDEVYGKKDDGYADGIYHWFGGKSIDNYGNTSYGLSYAAGFFPSEEGSTVGKIKIMEAKGGVGTGSDQKVLAESAEIDLGTDWHEAVFVFDEEACAAFYYLDGRCMAGAWDPGMDMEGHDQTSIIRRLDVSCQIANLAIGSTTAFLGEAQGFNVICDGEVIGVFGEGETVELPVPALRDDDGAYYRFFTWGGADVTRSEFSSATATANGRTYTLVMPADDVELTSQFVLIGDLDANGKITSKDVATLKKIIAGNIVNVTDYQYEAADINCDGKHTSKDTSLMKKLANGSYVVGR